MKRRCLSLPSLVQLRSFSACSSWVSISSSCPSMSGYSTSRTLLRTLLYHRTTKSRFWPNCRSLSLPEYIEAALSGTVSIARSSRYLTSRSTATNCKIYMCMTETSRSTATNWKIYMCMTETSRSTATNWKIYMYMAETSRSTTTNCKIYMYMAEEEEDEDTLFVNGI